MLRILVGVLLITACGSRLTVAPVVNTTSSPKISKLDKLEANEGDKLVVTGTNLKDDIEVTINGETQQLVIEDEKTGELTLPHNLPSGVTLIAFSQGNAKFASLPIYTGVDAALPFTKLDESLVCDTFIFKNAQGELTRGTRDCSQPKAACQTDGQVDCLVPKSGSAAAGIEGLAAKVLFGETLAGISGTATPSLPDCTQDGVGACIADGIHFKAGLLSGITPNDLRLGLTAGAVVGSLSGIPIDCTSDGATNCLATTNFPAIDKVNVLDANLTKIRSSLSIAGVNGSLQNCSLDGESDCIVVGPNFSAALIAGADSKILSGQTVAGISGIAPVRPVDCSTDGQSLCTAVSLYPAVNKSLLSASVGKIGSTLTLGGVAGTLSSCLSDGQSSCVATTNFPTIQLTALQSNAAKILDDLVIGGVHGTLARCATDGGTGCLTVTNYPAADKSGAAAKIKSGDILASVTGTGAAKPNDCASDGSTDCVAVANYPAMEKTGAAAKIQSGATVGGVAGTAALRPSDCATDGDASCVAVAAFPAVTLATVQADRPKFSTSLTLAGLAGTLPDCSDGDSGCWAKNPTYAALLTTGAAAKIVSGQTIAGITGTGAVKPNDCATDGGTGCVTLAGYPALDASVAPNKIITGQILGGLTGSAPSGRPSDCNTDGETNCVSVSGFPAMKVAGAEPKIAFGDSAGGVTGSALVRPSDCSAADATNCVAVAAYPVVNKTALTSSTAAFATSLTIGGVTGTMTACSSDGQTSCMTSSTFPSETVVGAAANILTGQTLGGVAGSAPTTPSNCAASGSTGCVSVTAYPAINKSLIATSAAKMTSDFTVLGTTGLLNNCATDGQGSCVAVTGYPAALTTGAAAKILTGQTLAGVNGSAALKPSDCSTDGATECVAVTGFASVNKASITAAHIRTGTTIANVAGTLNDCSADGSTLCYSVAAFPAALTTGAAAKIISPNVLAGTTGTATARPADCSAEGSSNCVAVASFPAIDTASLTSKAASIQTSTTIMSTTGTLADCAADGLTNCVTTTSFAAANTTGAAAKIIDTATLAGLTGTAASMPADCSAENQTSCVTVAAFPSVNKSAATASLIRSGTSVAGVAGTLADCSTDGGTACVAVTNYPAVVQSNVTAGVVKNGSVIAGVTGAYPSSTYLLAGSTASTTDDVGTASDLFSRLGNTASFEFFDSAGNHYTVAGDANATAANIKSGVSLFGLTGTYTQPSNCATDGDANCWTVAAYPSADTSAVTSYDIRVGTTAAGIAGSLYFADSSANLSFFNRTTGTGASASTTVADIYDSVDDYTRGSYSFNDDVNVPNGTRAALSTWQRETETDTNGNGICDGADVACRYVDLMTNIHWAWVGNPGAWEAAITSCNGLNTYGHGTARLPTQKELIQAYIDGFAFIRANMGIGQVWMWSATTDRGDSTALSYAWAMVLHHGQMDAVTKTDTGRRTVCVYE